MDLVDKYVEEVETIKGLIRPIADEYYPSKANRGVISLYGLITAGIPAHSHFNGVTKHAYVYFTEDLKLFPGAGYSKLIERLNRYGELLYGVLDCVFERVAKGEIRIVDAKPVETRELVRSNRHKKRGESEITGEKERRQATAHQKGFCCGYKITCITDGRFLDLLHVDTARKHGLMLRENTGGFSGG